MTLQLNPYLVFPGTCAEAMRFYAAVLGGVSQVSTFSDYGIDAEGVMHAVLRTTKGFQLFGADAIEGVGAPLLVGNNVQVSLTGEAADTSVLRSYWAALAEGGEVLEPLEAQLWGDEQGLLVDKFGVRWQVSVAASVL